MLKSPLRYPGGKSRAVQRIGGLLPAHFDEYREPFLGGGSVFIHTKQRFPNKRFWVNDLYTELYTFWTVLQNNPAEIIAQIESWKLQFAVGKDLHRYLLDNKGGFNPMETAAAFFVFNRVTFSGTTEAGGFSEQAFQSRFTVSSIQRLMPIHHLLQGTRITHLDYQEVVEAEGEKVFIFLDPPYYSATKSALYGKNGNLHKIFDHQRLADTLRHCPHQWLMTYDDSEYIRNLFSFANVFSFDLMYGMRNTTEGSNQVGKELFISNYLTELPELLQAPLF